MKKRYLLLAMLTLPVAVSTQAQPQNQNTFQLEISGAEQVRTANIPNVDGQSVTIPVGPLVSGGHGTAVVTVAANGSQLQYQVQASGTGTPIFMGHIHLGPRGANGPILFWLFGDQGNAPFTLPRDDGPWTGQITGTLTSGDLNPAPELGVETFQDAINNILNGNTYVNFHTVANPPGELRGQIRQTPATVPPGTPPVGVPPGTPPPDLGMPPGGIPGIPQPGDPGFGFPPVQEIPSGRGSGGRGW